jgi:starvation-inducible DNA-binding protein
MGEQAPYMGPCHSTIPTRKETNMADRKALEERAKAPLKTPTDLKSNATKDISGALNELLADTFALYLKTKNFHWHMSGPHFRD